MPQGVATAGKRKRPGLIKKLIGLGPTMILILCCPLLASKVETWRQAGAGAFGKGSREKIVLTKSGTIRLSHPIRPTAPLDAVRVWDLARGNDGTLFAATGDEGVVFRRRPDHGSWERRYEGDDSQVFCLASLPDGRVFAGTGPRGRVVEVTDSEFSSETLDPATQYVWDLAPAPDGRLFAATGPKGQLWERSVEGEWTLRFDSRHTHLLSVAVAPDGNVFTGSDGEGILYKLDPEGDVSVVFDAPQEEIRCVLIGGNGDLYAGTAGGDSQSRGSDSARAESNGNAPRKGLIRLASARQEPVELTGTLKGTATIERGNAADNIVFQVGGDGVPREVFRARALIHSLAWWHDRLLIGTGPEAQLFEVRPPGGDHAPIARLDHGQVLALLPEPDGSRLWIGVGDPGAVVEMDRSYEPKGTLTSEVFDAQLVSQFGALTWDSERPEGTEVAVQVRTGNVGEPDRTWSDWSDPLTDPNDASASTPPGRFAQYRLTLSTNDPEQTPEFRSISFRYRARNLPPELGRVIVPDVREGEGATRKTQLALKWEASDPNDDDLEYTLEFRKDDWPGWVTLTETPLRSESFDWDVSGVPAGSYRVRVTATDRLSNLAEEAFERSTVSEPFLIDHQPPVVALQRTEAGVKATVEDALTRLVKAEYAVDGGPWTPVFPEDGLFDTRRETIQIPLDDLKPGTHVLMLRATDAAGNVGANDLVFEIDQ